MYNSHQYTHTTQQEGYGPQGPFGYCSTTTATAMPPPPPPPPPPLHYAATSAESCLDGWSQQQQQDQHYSVNRSVPPQLCSAATSSTLHQSSSLTQQHEYPISMPMPMPELPPPVTTNSLYPPPPLPPPPLPPRGAYTYHGGPSQDYSHYPPPALSSCLTYPPPSVPKTANIIHGYSHASLSVSAAVSASPPEAGGNPLLTNAPALPPATVASSSSSTIFYSHHHHQKHGNIYNDGGDGCSMASVTTPPYTPVTAAGDGGTHHDSSRAKADAKSAALGPPSPQHVPTIAEELDRRQARARASTQIFTSQPESLLPYSHPALHNNGNGGGEYYNRTSIFVSTNYSHSPPLPQCHPPHPHVSNPMSAFPLQDPNRANTFAMDSGGSSDLNLQPQPYQKPPLMLHHSLTTIGVYNDDTSTPWASSASLSATSVTEPSHLAQQQQFSHYTRPVSIATTTSVPPAISAASTLTPDSQYFVPPPPQPLPLSQAPTAYHQKYHGVLSTCTGKKRALIITINYYSKPYSLSGVINVGDPLREMLVQSYGYPRADIHVLSDIPTLTDQSLYATYKNIRSCIDEILRDAEPNDSFFFYYGGLDRVPYKLASGNDKLVAKLRSRQGVIFPTDFETENLFTSRKLNKHILRQVPRGARVTIVLDCVRYFNPLGLGFNYGYDGMALMSPLSSIPVDGSKHRGRYEIVTAHGNHHHRGGGGGGGGGGGSGGRENLMDSLVGSMNSLQLVDARPPTEDSDGQGDIIMISLCRVYTGQQQQGQSASDNASMRFKAAPSALLANALLTSHQSRNTTRGNLTPLPELMNDLYQTVGEWDLAPYVSAGRQIDFHNEYLDI